MEDDRTEHHTPAEVDIPAEDNQQVDNRPAVDILAADKRPSEDILAVDNLKSSKFNESQPKMGQIKARKRDENKG